MIIPIRCFTCGNIIASKYERYKTLIQKNSNNSNILSIDNKKNKSNNIYNECMEKVGLKRYCCKRHILGHNYIFFRIIIYYQF